MIDLLHWTLIRTAGAGLLAAAIVLLSIEDLWRHWRNRS